MNISEVTTGSDGKYLKYFRYLYKLNWILAVLSLGYFAYKYSSFLGYPVAPSPQTAQTVAYEVKGRIVYITQDELSLVTVLKWASFTFVLLGFFLMVPELKSMERKKRLG